jgi:drug/metabolite transporter (DMT)-like permease
MLPRDFAVLLLVCLVWASNFVIAKLVLSDLHIPPLFLSAVRLAIVLIAVCPWGVLMGAGSFGLVTVGLMTAAPSSVAVVVQLAALFRFCSRKLLGVVPPADRQASCGPHSNVYPRLTALGVGD